MNHAMANGALGGKLIGAGAAVSDVLCGRQKKAPPRDAQKGLQEVRFRFTSKQQSRRTN